MDERTEIRKMWVRIQKADSEVLAESRGECLLQLGWGGGNVLVSS